MNRPALRLNVILLLLGSLWLTQPCIALNEVRTWTSVSDQTVEASLISHENGKAVLQKPNGQKFSIAIKGLSQTDQDYLALKVPKVILAKAPNLLPLLPNTTWTMNLTPKQNRSPDRLSQEIEVHMIYEGSTYTAAMGSTGLLYIQPKTTEEAPLRVNAPMTIRWGHSYKQGTTYVARKRLEYVDPPVPQRDPQSIKLEALLEDESTISMHIDFTPTSFTIRSFLTDPPDTKTPTLFGWGFGIPPSHQFPSDMQWAESKTHLEGEKIRIKTLDDNETYDLITAQTVSRIIKSIVESNRWQGRKVTIETIREKGTVTGVRINNYTGTSLFQGYALQSKNNTIAFQSGETSKRLNPATFKVTIE